MKLTTEKMVAAFTEWFSKQENVDPEKNNTQLIESLCNHLTNCRPLTQFEATYGTGTTTTLERFAEWLFLEDLINSPAKVIIISDAKPSRYNQARRIHNASWNNSFYGYKGHLFLCESMSDKYWISNEMPEHKTIKLLSTRNSVFYVRKSLVGDFLQAVNS